MRVLIAPILVIIIDQTAKFLANKDLLPSVGGFFETISCNKGIAFGTELPLFAFISLWLLSITAILWLIKNEKENLALLLVLGGAISNILDRAISGCVTDYISLLGIPTFNFADTAICLGITYFALKTLFANEKSKN